MINQAFSQLTVIEELKERTKQRRKQYRCVCECGKEIIVAAHNLKSGRTKSCGCSRRKKNVTTNCVTTTVVTTRNRENVTTNSHVVVTNTQPKQDRQYAMSKIRKLDRKIQVKAMSLFNREKGNLTIEEAIERASNGR